MTDDTRKADQIRQFFHDFRRSTGKLKQQTPEMMNGFSAMSAKIMQDGAVPLKTKELIAVAIAVALPSEPCIRLHVQKCLDLGLTRAEILDAASVAVMMGGAPAWTHMATAVETIEAIEAEPVASPVA